MSLSTMERMEVEFVCKNLEKKVPEKRLEMFRHILARFCLKCGNKKDPLYICAKCGTDGEPR